MVYKYLILTLCLCSTMSLYAEGKGLGDIIKDAGQDKTLVKPIVEKKKVKKESRFVFKDEYDANGIGLMDKTAVKDKSERYDYKDKSRFKFKFNDGSQQSNFVGSYGSGSISGSMGGGHASGGGGRR